MTSTAGKPSKKQLRDQRRLELPPGNVAEFKNNR
jgi:hypothetical protein